MSQDSRHSERRFSRPADPRLSDDANRLLDRELAEATGAEVVEVPAREGAPAPRRSGFVAELVEQRLLLGVTLIVVVIAGLVAALATGYWIILVGLLALHAVATMLVAGGVFQLAGETEHVSPELAAELEAEGIGDPDRMFTNLVGDVERDQERNGPSSA